MTRVEFHDAGADPLALVLRLASKATQPVLILAADAEQARRIDDDLWAVADDAFVPHAFADDPDRDAAIVLIATPGQEEFRRPVVVNLCEQAVEIDCERIVELVPADEVGKQSARARWRAYQARGLKPAKMA